MATILITAAATTTIVNSLDPAPTTSLVADTDVKFPVYPLKGSVAMFTGFMPAGTGTATVEISANPWQIFEPEAAYIPVTTGASGSLSPVRAANTRLGSFVRASNNPVRSGGIA